MPNLSLREEDKEVGAKEYYLWKRFLRREGRRGTRGDYHEEGLDSMSPGSRSFAPLNVPERQSSLEIKRFEKRETNMEVRSVARIIGGKIGGGDCGKQSKGEEGENGVREKRKGRHQS